MGEHRRRVFSTEFKRATVQRVVTGEKTVAELSRELDITPSVIRSWKRFAAHCRVAARLETNHDATVRRLVAVRLEFADA